MKTVTVIIDSREKKGFELPFRPNLNVSFRRSKRPTLVRVTTKVERMAAGDYTLKGFEELVNVETKRSALEVAENLLTRDFLRASKAFERFAACAEYPLLVCEFSIADLYAENARRQNRLVDALSHEVARHGVSMFFTGPCNGIEARRRTADFVLRLMLSRVDMEFPNLVVD